MKPQDRKMKTKGKMLPPKVLREIRKAFEQPLNPARYMGQSLKRVNGPEDDSLEAIRDRQDEDLKAKTKLCPP